MWLMVIEPPFLRQKELGAFSGSDLAVAAGLPLLNRQLISPSQLDEVIIGSAMPGPDEANIARVVALRLGCGEKSACFYSDAQLCLGYAGPR